MDGDTVTHAELGVGGDATIFLSSPAAYVNPKRRRALAPELDAMYDNEWVIDGHYVEVSDLDAHYANAVAGGATIVREPEDPGVGARIYTAEDPEGHRWMFGQRL